MDADEEFFFRFGVNPRVLRASPDSVAAKVLLEKHFRVFRMVRG
jgi:hypothetical protein